MNEWMNERKANKGETMFMQYAVRLLMIGIAIYPGSYCWNAWIDHWQEQATEDKICLFALQHIILRDQLTLRHTFSLFLSSLCRPELEPE
jgi:hypothetical protein